MIKGSFTTFEIDHFEMGTVGAEIMLKVAVALNDGFKGGIISHEEQLQITETEHDLFYKKVLYLQSELALDLMIKLRHFKKIDLDSRYRLIKETNTLEDACD